MCSWDHPSVTTASDVQTVKRGSITWEVSSALEDAEVGQTPHVWQQEPTKTAGEAIKVNALLMCVHTFNLCVLSVYLHMYTYVSMCICVHACLCQCVC